MPSTHLGAAGPKGRATVGLWVQVPPGGGSEDTQHVLESLSRSLLGKERWYQRCLEDVQRGQACRPGSHSLSQEQTGTNSKQNSAMSERTPIPAPRCMVQSMASQLTPGLRLELGAWADSGGGNLSWCQSRTMTTYTRTPLGGAETVGIPGSPPQAQRD